jgi:hypothetical protein
MGPWVELLGTWYEIDEISKVVLIYDSPACDHGPNASILLLSAVLATLNLIAFAIHLAAELAEITWKAAIEAAGARVRFFENLRALTAYLLFPSWHSLLETLAFRAPPPLPS